MHDAAGVAIRMIGMMEDISERKRAEAKIHELAYREPVTRLPKSSRTPAARCRGQSTRQGDGAARSRSCS